MRRSRAVPKPPVELPSGFVTLRGLANYYKISKDTVSAAHKRGEIPGSFETLGRLVFEFAVAKNWVPHEAVAKGQLAPIDGKGTPKFVKENTMSKLGIAPRRKRTYRYPKISKKDAALYNDTLVEVLTQEKWRSIVERAVEEAEAGGPDGHRARVWLGNYVLGRPVERIKAEIDLNVRQSFTPVQRADAIRALFGGLSPAAGEVIDVTPTEVVEEDDGGAA